MTALLDHVPGASRAVLLPRPNPSPSPEPPLKTAEPEPEPAPAAEFKPEPAPEPTPDPEPAEHPAPLPDLVEPEPAEHPAPPTFGGVDWVGKLFGASIVFSAIGQVLFWGTFFSGVVATAFPTWSPAVPWVVALALGGVFEIGMVVFADLGMSRRDGTSQAWCAWFLVGVAIAVFCISINVAHWWHADRVAAVTFGGVGAMGFVAHLAKGLAKSQRHIEQCRAVDAENERRREAYNAELKRRRDAAELAEQRRHELRMAAARGDQAPAAEPEPRPTPAERTSPTLQAVGSQSRPRSTNRKRTSKRTSRAEYLARAREHFAGEPTSEITVGAVERAAGCARSTASDIANELKNERAS